MAVSARIENLASWFAASVLVAAGVIYALKLEDDRPSRRIGLESSVKKRRHGKARAFHRVPPLVVYVFCGTKHLFWIFVALAARWSLLQQ
jgi:hypothetical protein